MLPITLKMDRLVPVEFYRKQSAIHHQQLGKLQNIGIPLLPIICRGEQNRLSFEYLLLPPCPTATRIQNVVIPCAAASNIASHNADIPAKLDIAVVRLLSVALNKPAIDA